MANRIRLKGTSEKSFEIGLTNKQIFDANGLTANRTWTMPDSNGTSGFVLTTNGAGVLSWSAAPVTSVSGTSNQVTVSPTTGAVVVSLPSTLIAPGTVQATSGFISATASNSLTSITGVGLGIRPGAASSGTAAGNNIQILGGSGGFTSGAGGILELRGGSPGASANGGNVTIDAGSGGGTSGNGGDITITAGPALTSGNGGNVTIEAETGAGAGTNGTLTLRTNNTNRLVIGGSGGWSINGSEGTSTHVLTSAGAGATPTWSAIPANVSSFSAGTTGFTPSSPTTGAVVLAGTLNIANGGTGQTSAVAAFDALAPTTTKGDLIVHNGTDNIRVAVGATTGHVLTVDPAEASGVKWAAAAGPGGGATYVDFTKDLGAARRSGTFDITGLAGLTPDKNVAIMQTMKPIASKGDARDEPEMDMIMLTGYVLNSTTIRAIWNSGYSPVVGTYAFAYMVSS